MLVRFPHLVDREHRKKKDADTLLTSRVSLKHCRSLFSDQKTIKSFKKATSSPNSELTSLLSVLFYGRGHPVLMFPTLSCTPLTSKHENKKESPPKKGEVTLWISQRWQVPRSSSWKIIIRGGKKRTSNPRFIKNSVHKCAGDTSWESEKLTSTAPERLNSLKSIQVIAAHLWQSKYSINSAFLITVIPSTRRTHSLARLLVIN